MEALFDPRFQPLWALILALALFLPVRRLIWVLYMRRAQKQAEDLDEVGPRLQRRSTVTAALLALVFSYMYTSYLFGG